MGQYKFIIPNKKGTEQYLKEIPDNILLGFYRVKITSDHKHATKLFAFSSDDVYNNISLDHAIELQDDYNFKIDLIIDDKPNAYIYPPGIRSSSVFGVWVDN
jgi:predicted AlkP superfamily pyrophosphatase or phosphodiesterase